MAYLVVAAIYLSWVFNANIALIIITTSFPYAYTGICGTKMVAPIRREYSKRDRTENKILYDSVGNWQMVIYYKCKQYKQDRYLKAVRDNLSAERRY